jgi:hypothetical protein
VKNYVNNKKENTLKVTSDEDMFVTVRLPWSSSLFGRNERTSFGWTLIKQAAIFSSK